MTESKKLAAAAVTHHRSVSEVCRNVKTDVFNSEEQVLDGCGRKPQQKQSSHSSIIPTH